MALTPAQQAKLDALKVAFRDVWQKALLGLEFSNKVQDRADDADLSLTDAQKQTLMAKIIVLIGDVNTANTALQALK